MSEENYSTNKTHSNESKEIENCSICKINTVEKNNILLDWYRFCKDSSNIAGNHGVIREISIEELAMHNKEDDCWISIYGLFDCLISFVCNIIHYFIIQIGYIM
jgi:hypothetical protein